MPKGLLKKIAIAGAGLALLTIPYSLFFSNRDLKDNIRTRGDGDFKINVVKASNLSVEERGYMSYLSDRNIKFELPYKMSYGNLVRCNDIISTKDDIINFVLFPQKSITGYSYTLICDELFKEKVENGKIKLYTFKGEDLYSGPITTTRELAKKAKRTQEITPTFHRFKKGVYFTRTKVGSEKNESFIVTDYDDNSWVLSSERK